jgi:tetratricopeptide (TPR) repeat protein
MIGFEHAQQLQALAEAYHRAALQEADMPAVTRTLEALRGAWAAATEENDAWREADDAIGRTDDPVLTTLLLALRERLERQVTEATLAELRQAFALGEATGRQALKTACVSAFAKGRPELAEALAQADYPGLAADDADRRQLLELLRLGRLEAWPLAEPVLDALADDGGLPPREASHLHVMLGQIALYYGPDTERAQRRFEQALALQPEYGFAWVGMGQHWLEQADFVQAMRCFERAAEIDPRDGGACANIGDCLDKQGKTPLAQEWYEEGRRRQPGSATCGARLLRLWGRRELSGDHADVPDRLTERMLRAEPGSAHWTCREAGYACFQREEHDAALAWFERAIALDPQHPDGYIGQAQALEALQRDAEALAAAEHAIAVLPEGADGHALLARLAEGDELWARAELAHRAAAEHKPPARLFHLAKAAEMAWHDGRRGAARAELLAMLRDAPQDDTVLGTLERLADATQRQLEDRRGALALLAEVRAVAGESYAARHHNRLGDLAEAATDLDAAAAEYRAAIAADPRRALYYSNLARVWRAQRHWDETQALWDAAPEAVKADANLRSWIGTLFNQHAVEHHDAGAYGEAIALYRRSLAVNPEDAVVHSNLSLALEAVDDTFAPLAERLAAALAELAQAIALRPQEEDYKQRQAVLQARADALAGYGEQAVRATWIASPLVIEVASGLLPLVEAPGSGLTAQMQELLVGLRSRMRERYGLILPGVRIRGNSDWPGGTYVIRLQEDPVATGELALDRHFCPAADAALAGLDLATEPATVPGGGPQGHWVRASDAERAATAGLELWPVMAFAVRHLETLLRHELASLIGCDDVETLLREADETLPARVLGCQGGLPGFVAALRRLLAEQVPIVAIAALARCHAEQADAGAPLAVQDAALRALAGVKESLPGQAAAWRLAPGAALQRLLRQGVRDDDAMPSLRLLPQPCQNALAALRRARDGHPDSVLVVDGPAPLRLLLRGLVAIEMPDLPVLAHSELPAPVRIHSRIAL